jgi:hypothetical protein
VASVNSMVGPGDGLLSGEASALEGQPPWDLLALLTLAFIVFGWMALAVSYNPSHGAQFAFERFHTVALHQFQTLPWDRFLHEMHTTYGPAFYALVGSLHLPTQGVRAVGLVMHLLSTLLLLQVALRTGAPWQRAALLSVAFFASPFQFGPALWGHPDALAMLLTMLGLGATLLASAGAHRSVSIGLLPLTVLVHQAGAAVVAASCLDDLRLRRFADMALKLLVTTLMLTLLYRVWDGFTPPSLQRATQINTRAFLMAFTLLALGLHAWDRLNTRTRAIVLLARFALLWPLFTALYAVSAPFAGGGFIFSRLDLLDGGRLPVNIASPALMAAVVAWSWASLVGYRLSTAQITLCAAVLATGQALYLKDIDFFFWPLLLMRLVRWGQQRPQMRDALMRSAVVWTLVSLTLATLSYSQL